MSERDRLRATLAEARADLLTAVDGVTEQAFLHRPPGGTGDEASWSIRDVLWHVGYMEDWRRRVIKQGVEGSGAPPLEHRRRPGYLDAPALLVEWLEQSRRPMLSLLARMSEDDLERSITLADGARSTPREQLEAIAEHDREHAAQVRELRGSTRGSDR